MARTVREIAAEETPNLKLMLQLVYQNAEISPLINRGLRYSQIARLLNIAHELGLIAVEDDVMRVTEQGMQFLREQGEPRTRSDGGWISPAEEDKIEKSGLYDVYLPTKKTVRSLRQVGH